MDRRQWIKSSTLVGSSVLLSGTVLSNLKQASEKFPGEFVVIPKWNEESRSIKHTWEGLCNVDQLKWILRKDMQEQLIMAHNDLKIKHVRAIGMFDDDLRVFGPDPKEFAKEQRERRLNWRNIDCIYDSLVEAGLSPMVTTCFMPQHLASGRKFTLGRNNITPPKSLDEWGELINLLVVHCQNRYGKEALKNWYFEVWNEPNLSGFWSGDIEAYFKLFEKTYKSIKKIDQSLRIGGPSTARGEFLGEFLEYTRRNGCEPDYLISHCYNNDSAENPASPFDGIPADKLSGSSNFLSGVVKGVKNQLTQLSYNGEVHWNEWGYSWFPFCAERESINEAAYIIKTMKEVSQFATYFSYWDISDIYDQVGFGKEAFHGNYGMISLDGLKKPSYHAHQLLSSLGHQEILTDKMSEDGNTDVWVTFDKNNVTAIFYSFDPDYTNEKNPERINIKFLLPKNTKKDKIKLVKLGSKENNILHEWKQMGSPDYLSKAEVDYLKTRNNLTESNLFKLEKFDDDKDFISFSIEKPGVARIEISGS